MKTSRPRSLRQPAVALGVAVMTACLAVAGTTINSVNWHAYGANVGWLNARGDVSNGAVIGRSYCTGLVWSANCGWISLGNGPTNGWRYSNASANDWGVNHDGLGRLRGLAYGANVGWISFETNGDPRVSLLTGAMDGHAYGANVGWIGLSNAFAFVQTDRLDAGPDADGDGIPDAWELAATGSLTELHGGAADRDGDGRTDTEEYLADTDPLDAGSHLRMVSLMATGSTKRVAWTVEPTRFYRLEQSGHITNVAAWADSGLGQLMPGTGPTLTGVVTEAAGPAFFYRASAMVPLAP